MRPGHLSIRAGDSLRRSEEIVKNLELCFESIIIIIIITYYHYLQIPVCFELKWTCGLVISHMITHLDVSIWHLCHGKKEENANM